LQHFPSASGIEYCNGNFYIFGDDAPYFLKLNRDFQLVDSVHYMTDTAYRIAKDKKPDLESVALHINGKDSGLLVLGSFASKPREQVFYFPLHEPHTYRKLDPQIFHRAIGGIKEPNIEGLATVGNSLLLANRANKKQRANSLILVENYWGNGPVTSRTIELHLPSNVVLGVSGLYYFEEKDILFFTASNEETTSAIDDGTIGNSYIGWIKGFREKNKKGQISPDEFYDLSKLDNVLKNQKIESVCVEDDSAKGTTLLLAADNDDGNSGLFRIRVQL
jgi:hypothetical protein